MAQQHNRREESFFQTFVNREMEIQCLQEDWYEGDKYLCDKLGEEIDIHTIKGYLKGIPTRSSQKLFTREDTKLSDRTRTFGSS